MWPVFGQHLVNTESYYNKGYSFEKLTSKDGLSSSNVATMVQDQEGYLWIGTADGINRYDGYTCEVFKKSAGSLGPNFSTIWKVAVDKRGIVWMVSQSDSDCKIAQYNPTEDKFTNFGREAGLPGGQISCLFFDSNNRAWIGIYNDGLYSFDATRRQFYKLAGLPQGEGDASPCISIYDMSEDENGMLWLATSCGLFNFNAASRVYTRKTPPDPIVFGKARKDDFNSILRAPDGFWLSGGNGGGLIYYDIPSSQATTYRYNLSQQDHAAYNYITAIAPKSSDELWLCSLDAGLLVFNTTTKQFSSFSKEVFEASTIFIDKSGIPWIGSRFGLYKYIDKHDQPEFHKVKVSRATRDSAFIVTSFHHDLNERKLYYGTSWADGLHIVDEVTHTERVVPTPASVHLDAIFIRDIHQDQDRRLWIVSTDQLVYLDDKSERVVEVLSLAPDSVPGFRNVIRGRIHDDLWIGSENGLLRYDLKTKRLQTYRKNNSAICSNVVRDIQEDKLGRIWAATDNGLSIFDYKTDSFLNFLNQPGDSTSLISNTLSTLAMSPYGDIWISSYTDGLCQAKIDDAGKVTFIQWNLRKGLPSEVLYSVAVDRNGTAWANAPGVLFSLDIHGVVQAYPYTQHWGRFPIAIDGENTLFISAYGGYIKFPPDKAAKSHAPPTVGLTAINVLDEPVHLLFDSAGTAVIDLPYDKNFLSFSFSVFDFKDPPSNRYAYYMDALEKSWNYSGGRHFATYTNLEPGRYKFIFKGANANGTWSNPKTVVITVRPAFWQTLSFKVVVATLVVLSAFLIVSRRVESLKRSQQLRITYERRVKELEMDALRSQLNPHFIFNCLNSINRYIAKTDTERATYYLSQFAKLIRIVLEHSRYTLISLEDEMRLLHLYLKLELVRLENKFSYHFNIGDGIDVEHVRIPPMILQPLIENAIWHGLVHKDTAGNIIIDVSIIDKALVIKIDDDGIGMEEARKRSSTSTKKSIGVQIIRERLDLIKTNGAQNAGLEYINLVGQGGASAGTRVVVTLPLIQDV